MEIVVRGNHGRSRPASRGHRHQPQMTGWPSRTTRAATYCVASRLAASAFNRKAGLSPGVHAALDVVDVPVAEIGQRFCRDIAPVAGLAIDHNVVFQLGPDLAMAGFDFSEVDVEIRSRNGPGHMFLR